MSDEEGGYVPTDEEVQQWVGLTDQYLTLGRAVAKETGESLQTVLLALTWRTFNGMHAAIVQNQKFMEEKLAPHMERVERELGGDEPWKRDE